MNYLSKYEFWLKHATDSSVVESLQAMAGNDGEIKNAFYKDLEFGTAGLRGIMTAGTDRMNVYTVYRATEGLARYMEAHKMTTCSITYDSRLNSQLFAEVSAATLARHGIKVYITEECMPTPYLSYMVRNYHTDTGINVTASHNPQEYNGYKVYDSYGCQLTDDAAMEVTGYINGVDPFGAELPKFADYVGGLIVYSDKEMEESYINRVLQESLNDAKGLSAVYTPLNGAGYRVVPEVLRRIGLEDMQIVPEQAMPDGRFPTCTYPNPEKKETMALAVAMAKQSGADIVIGNDPDCDRLGVAVRTNGDYRILTGNEVGILLCDYVLSKLSETGKLPQDPVLVKTIVTTIMVDAIAKQYGAEVRDVLTGFKYIGNVIAELEEKGQEQRYLFGFEESCGYLKGTYVRDKDGVVASMLVAQCANYHKQKGQTLVDRLEQLYDKLGLYFQQTVSYAFGGADGAERKAQLLANLRANPIQNLGESKVVRSCDFLTQTEFDLPKADVLRYNSEDGSQLIVRPSGTEPLIKCYITVCGDKSVIDSRFQSIKQQMDKIFG